MMSRMILASYCGVFPAYLSPNFSLYSRYFMQGAGHCMHTPSSYIDRLLVMGTVQ